MLSALKARWFHSDLREYILVTRNNLFDRVISRTERPVFIVGCGHSGTTLMAALLGRHANLYLIPYETEIFYLNNSGPQITEFFKEKIGEASGKRLLEKTPRHVHRIGRIFRFFPNGRIVAMVRDGRDVACSIRKRKGSLEKGISRWLKDCKALEKYLDDERIKIVRYENLVLKSAQTIGEILKFLDELGDPEKLLKDQKAVLWSGALPAPTSERELKNSEIEHLERRKEQINKPIYDGRGIWHEQMSNEEHEFFMKVAGAALIRWGYSSQKDVKK